MGKGKGKGQGRIPREDRVKSGAETCVELQWFQRREVFQAQNVRSENTTNLSDTEEIFPPV